MRSVTVAYQGEPGAFSEAALLGLLVEGTVPAPRHSFQDVVEAVGSGEVDLGLLPVENSLAGTVAPAWDALAAAALEIFAETVHPIRLFLLARPGTALGSVRRLLSHPVALAQCTRFLRSHSSIEAIAVHDTAGAARIVTESAEPGSAAVAGPEAAARYGLDILVADIQDRADNRTRFLLVGRPGANVPLRSPSGRRKTALMLELENQPGALLGALAPFADAKINLAHLECRPAETPWTYRFFMELEADAGEPATARAIDTIRRDARVLRVLGSFAAAPQSESLRSTSSA